MFNGAYPVTLSNINRIKHIQILGHLKVMVVTFESGPTQAEEKHCNKGKYLILFHILVINVVAKIMKHLSACFIYKEDLTFQSHGHKEKDTPQILKNAK